MIKVEVIENFSLKEFSKISNLVRANAKSNEEGKLKVGDVFECDKEMAEYLTGNNKLNRPVVKIIEVVPEVLEQVEVVEPPKVVKEVAKPRKAKLKKNK